jgi:hypothetical protein
MLLFVVDYFYEFKNNVNSLYNVINQKLDFL